jgi:hypothetical protein
MEPGTGGVIDEDFAIVDPSVVANFDLNQFQILLGMYPLLLVMHEPLVDSTVVHCRLDQYKATPMTSDSVTDRY